MTPISGLFVERGDGESMPGRRAERLLAVDAEGRVRSR
jgi:hypothetical protein